MNKTELKKLKAAVKAMSTENDTLSIQGNDFSCRWNGKEFIWTMPSKHVCTMTAKEVNKYIANGSYITDHCFSYGE